MSLPYFPMYPSDFEAKTSHLTIAEDGAYNRLLRICWMTPGCSMPADEAWVMRRVRAHTDEEQEAVRAVLGEFFKISDGRYSNARLTNEWVAANEAHEKRKNAGSKGGIAKSQKTNKKTSSNATSKPEQCSSNQNQNQSHIKREANASPKKGTRIAENWQLPREWGEWALSEGLDELAIRREAEKFKDYWQGVSGQRGVKLDWKATWRNWCRKYLDDQPSKPSASNENFGAFGRIPVRG